MKYFLGSKENGMELLYKTISLYDSNVYYGGIEGERDYRLYYVIKKRKIIPGNKVYRYTMKFCKRNSIVAFFVKLFGEEVKM